MDYSSFLQSKHIRVQPAGIDIPEERLCQKAFDWQRSVCKYWLHLGRAGGFEAPGLGKSIQELMYGEALLLADKAERVLLLTPLAVAQQMPAEAEKFGIRVKVKVVKRQAEVESGISVCNYERLHLLDLSQFDVIILDESSILKSFMGKTKRALVAGFQNYIWKLCATATPAPNDWLELGNQADFLGIMRANEMLMRWFINDSMSAGNYRLKRHAEADYWKWVVTWSIAASKPSDLGNFSDAGYELPPLNLVEHIVGKEQLQAKDLSATEIHKEKRARAPEWANKIAELVAANKDEAWVNWCDTNYESDELQRAMPSAVDIRGSESLEAKEEKLAAFASGQIKHLITKPEIAGFGLNWQHCHNTTFPASYSFERFYQASKRFHRFGQFNTVNCHIVMTGAEASIANSLREKAERHEQMQMHMASYVKDFQASELSGALPLIVAEKPVLYSGEGYELWRGDCVEVTRGLPDSSIDFCIHSPPFSNLYIYSDSASDMGNAKDHAEFFRHYTYLIRELYRVMVAGRLCAVHCKDLPLYKGRDGAAGLYAFPDDILRAFIEAGWTFHSRVTIWKDPVTEMQRTKNHGLLHKQLCKDSSASRQGMADFLLVFRKWPENCEAFPRPVTIGNRYCRFRGKYVGEEGPEIQPTEDISNLEAPDRYSIQVWQRYASPVWFDVRQMRVLNYRLGTEDKDEKHICPLQLDVIERAVELWTNPGDLVFSPFTGIGSEGYVSLKAGRRFVGAELKDSYVKISLANFAEAIQARERELVNPQRMLFGEEQVQETGTLAV